VDRVENKEAHERGRVTFVYSTLELRDEFIGVLFNGTAHSMSASAQVTARGALTSMIVAVSTRPRA
jgi:hypothetical protein